jgi:aminoglycoside phosphotransferase (APT) family kinase protein
MTPHPDRPDPEALRPVIERALPELAGAPLLAHDAGFDSLAVEVGGRAICKFPRDAAAADRLRLEARLLGIIRPAVTMPVPLMRLHEGPPLFSSHGKIPGRHLLAAGYAALEPAARQRLAEEMALLFAELHALDPARMAEAGASPIEDWPPAGELLCDLAGQLPPSLLRRAEGALRAWEELPPDIETFGYFDGHGWNMAFDHARGRLNGVYDFADAGFAPLHREFVPPTLVSFELAEGIAARYGRLTGRAVDVRRIRLLAGVQRLAELAGPPEPRVAPLVRRLVEEWAAAG